MAALAAYRIWKHVLLWLGVLLLLMIRVPVLWTVGEFVSEDGWVFFAAAFNVPWYESIVTPFAGYFRLDARLLAEAVSVLPWVSQPYVFAMGGLAINAIVLSLFYLPGFRHLISDDASRVAVVALLACAPHAENLGLITGLHWYLGFALTMFLFLQTPTNSAGRVALLLGASLCVWSSPSALVLIPFWVWHGFKATDQFTKRFSAIIVGQLILYALAVLVFRGTEGTRSAAFVMGDLIAAGTTLVGRGWLVSGLWGRGFAENVVGVAPILADGLALGLLLGLIFCVWKIRSKTKLDAVTLLIVGGLMLGFSLTRTLYLKELADLDLPRHVRYLTAPTLLLIVGTWVLLRPVLSGHWIKGFWLAQMAAFGFGLTAESHWARSPDSHRFRDQISAIKAFERDYVTAGIAGSLYLPNEIPYWGPVLESKGGVSTPPEVGALTGLGAQLDPQGRANSWMGSFTILSDSSRIDHEHWGRLIYTGTELGRVWFVDESGRQWFTSELLYPDAWVIDGLDMTYVSPLN